MASTDMLTHMLFVDGCPIVNALFVTEAAQLFEIPLIVFQCMGGEASLSPQLGLETL
jgi:hypothetical protein